MKRIPATKNSVILLLDGDTSRRNIRAMMLMTHGYDVHCASTLKEALVICRRNSPQLVLIGDGPDRQSHRWLQELATRPQQRVGFLLDEGENLCAVLFNGRTIMASEGPDDMVGRVEMLLGAA